MVMTGKLTEQEADKLIKRLANEKVPADWRRIKHSIEEVVGIGYIEKR